MARSLKKGSKKTGGKKMNLFMKKLNTARKKKLASFKYNGKTYKKHSKGSLIFYKAVV